MERLNGLMAIGVVLIVVGLLGFAIPVFTTRSTEMVARIGDLKIQSTEDISHRIPQILSGSALVLGMVIAGTSLYQKR